MNLELVFLGTGTSAGVPMIGCHCRVCKSDDPRDRRDRPSVLIRYADADCESQEPRQFIVDTAPELRYQAIRHQIDRIDGVLFTHAHADHVLGMDDLRRFNAVMDSPVDIYAEQRVIEQLERMFAYIFASHKNINQSFVASLIVHRIEVGLGFDLFGATWMPLRLMHGRLPIVGYRVDFQGASLAYCTDASRIVPETFPLLENLDVLVIDALRYRHHPTHMTIDQALELIAQVKPKHAYLTHLAHDVQHAELEANLPSDVTAAYDGLAISIHHGAIEHSPTG